MKTKCGKHLINTNAKYLRLLSIYCTSRTITLYLSWFILKEQGSIRVHPESVNTLTSEIWESLAVKQWWKDAKVKPVIVFPLRVIKELPRKNRWSQKKKASLFSPFFPSRMIPWVTVNIAVYIRWILWSDIPIYLTSHSEIATYNCRCDLRCERINFASVFLWHQLIKSDEVSGKWTPTDKWGPGLNCSVN